MDLPVRFAHAGPAASLRANAGDLTATDKRLVPYGAMTATFHAGLGCLLGPSLMYFLFLGIAGN